jgi:hypothetical protein
MELLKKLFKKDNTINEFKELTKRDEKELSIELIRKLLASIDLSDVRNKSIGNIGVVTKTETEHKNFIQMVTAFFPKIIEPEIKKMIIEQQKFIAEKVDNQELLMFSRGTINGLMLVYELFLEAFNEYMSSRDNDEEIDPEKLFPELYKEK